MRTVKKWLGHYSEFGLGVGFALSFVICLRMLMHGMVTNSLWVTLFGIVLFALLFLLTFLRYRYSVIEKNMDRDFQSIEIDDVQKNSLNMCVIMEIYSFFPLRKIRKIYQKQKFIILHVKSESKKKS